MPAISVLSPSLHPCGKLQRPSTRPNARKSRVALASRSIVRTHAQQSDVASSSTANAEPLNVDGFSPTNPRAWEKMSTLLQGRGVDFIDANTLVRLHKSGVPVIDVRPQDQVKTGIIEGAATIPIYSLITGWTPWKIVRRAGFAFFGIFNGTEYNESFEPEARQAVGSSSEVVIVCQVGGTLTPTQANPNGRQSRALIAAYALDFFGITKGKRIKVLDGGMAEWAREGRDVVELE